MDSITITETKVIEFYRENSHLNIVNINLIFIDILKQLSTNLASNLNNTVTSQILNVVNDIRTEVKSVNSVMQLKLNEIKKEYMTDVKLLFNNNELSISEKMNTLLNKNLDTIVSKTTNIINDVIPKSQAGTIKTLEQCIKTNSDAILKDTTALIASSTPEGKTDALEKLEKSFNSMINTLQISVHNSVQSCENRTTRGIQEIHDKMTIQRQIQETLTTELSGFLNKYKNNSSVKGNVSEMELYYMLQKIAPSDEIIRCSTEAATCDFKLRRKFSGLPTILFESKDYMATVNTEEVYKFERDLQIQRCHGIFISQNSPITFKDNYHIDVVDGIIHLYLSNVKYDVDKVKVAISIVDHLADRLNIIDVEDTTSDKVSISKGDFDELKEEYLRFAIRKNEMIDATKLFCKQMVDKLDEIKLPILQRVTGNSDKVNFGILCDICHDFWGKNQQAIGAHKRKCREIHPAKVAPSALPGGK